MLACMYMRGRCSRARICVAHIYTYTHIRTVVSVSRGVENHVLDEAIFCVQVRAAATALCVGMCVCAHVCVYSVCVCVVSAASTAGHVFFVSVDLM